MNKKDIASLAKDLEPFLSGRKGPKQSKPSAQHLFRIGSILYRFHLSDSAASDPRPEIKKLHKACRSLLSSMPHGFLESSFVTYKLLLRKLAQRASQHGEGSESQSSLYDSLSEAIQSMLGLVSQSNEVCQAASSKDFLVEMAKIYDQYLAHIDASTRHSDGAHLRDRRTKDDILGIVSFVLIDGPLSLDVPKKRPANDPESIEKFMQLIQSIENESTEFLGDLQEWQIHNDPRNRTLEGAIQSFFRPSAEKGGGADRNAISDQLDYLLSMLDTARQAHAERSAPVAATASPDNPKTEQKPKMSAVSAADELERRILQVQQILPDLGQGFIETALSLFQGNVETTVATLLNDPSNYPPSLQLIDRNLPRRRKERSAEETEASREARQLVKERVAVEQKAQEEKYKSFLYVAKQAQNEYNDDYDDQYDDMDDGGLGAADSGWSDMEHVKAYNQVAREEEAESSFWEGNRNLNRAGKGAQQQQKGNGSEDGEKQYRGPDKIKGGRVIGPDGKVVKKQGRGRKNNAGNSNNNSAAQQQKPQQNAKKDNNKNGNSKSGGNGQQQKPGQANSGGQQGDAAKHRTKPKSGNRINQRRDRKQKVQGTFGA